MRKRDSVPLFPGACDLVLLWRPPRSTWLGSPVAPKRCAKADGRLVLRFRAPRLCRAEAREGKSELRTLAALNPTKILTCFDLFGLILTSIEKNKCSLIPSFLNPLTPQLLNLNRPTRRSSRKLCDCGILLADDAKWVTGVFRLWTSIENQNSKIENGPMGSLPLAFPCPRRHS